MRGGRGQSREEFWESSDSDRSRKAGGDGVLGLDPDWDHRVQDTCLPGLQGTGNDKVAEAVK